MNVHAFYTAVRDRLADERPDLMVAVGRGLLLAFFAFTFLSGFVFTVIPLAENVHRHVIVHILNPLNRWVEAEPVTGYALMAVLQLSGLLFLLYLLRHWLLLAFAFAASKSAKLWARRPWAKARASEGPAIPEGIVT